MIELFGHQFSFLVSQLVMFNILMARSVFLLGFLTCLKNIVDEKEFKYHDS